MTNKRNFSIFFFVVMVVMVVGLLVLDGNESGEGLRDTDTAESQLP